jgi:periplasmic copper chaperone A
MRRYRWVMTLALLVGLTAGCAFTQQQPVEIRDAWVRPAAAGGETAVYFTIANHTKAPVTLTGIQSDWGDASMHQTVVENNGAMAKMMPVSSVEIPAGGQVAFTPGGYHVMIENLKGDLAPGEHVALSIRLEGGKSLSVTAVVQDQPGGHHH